MTPSDSRFLATVDTNIFISSLISLAGPPFAVTEAFRMERFVLLFSLGQRRELHRVLARPSLKRYLRVLETDVVELLLLIDQDARYVITNDLLPVHVHDPKDRVILSTALAGNADYLVTGDNDLLVLAGDPALGTLQIVTAAQFLIILDNQPSS